ncbi:DUF2905 domain-containing protein [Cohnella pontilimi]|uniref:DUF2905 domain-containing protein n=1 Tax=Cohnella pontilimi TaxID=2564100 RepID=A0A4U0FA16_9BACL|nr:DUF2905 domain-containing protein [Cohnella pontilimi]TJY41470.1 DUF2905 domain-containing protein [Cohnella pontilimi]
MSSMPKLFIAAGIVLVVVGLLWMAGGRWFSLGRLPGDIAYESDRVKFYFPIVSCILVSLLLALIFYVARWFIR